MAMFGASTIKKQGRSLWSCRPLSYAGDGAERPSFSAAVVAGRMVTFLVTPFPRFAAFFVFSVLVVQIAASRTGHTAQCGTGKGILIEHEGTGGTGGHAKSRARGDMFFLRSAGRERKGEGRDCEKGKDLFHCLLQRSGVNLARTPPESAKFFP